MYINKKDVWIKFFEKGTFVVIMNNKKDLLVGNNNAVFAKTKIMV